MKKKMALLLASVLASAVLAGCGSEMAETPLKDLDVEQYVTLGEYVGLEITLDPITVDDEEWQELIDSVYYDGAASYIGEIENGIMDRPVEVGDMVNIDYVGKKDEVAFDGGTAQGYNLGIGSGKFIDGFEDGLVGVMPGETLDLPLTFPESYGNTELAGQEVVFTVTVNCIVPEEMADEFAATGAAVWGIEGVSSMEELKQFIYDYLYSYSEQMYNSSLQYYVLDAFMNNCTFGEIPEELSDRYDELVRISITEEAEYYGMDAETYISLYYGMTLDEYVATYVPDAMRQELAFQAVANREDLNVSDEELNEILLEYATSAGYTTVEEFVGDSSLEDYRDYFMFDNVLNFLVENAQIIN